MASGIASPLIRAIQETTGKRAPEFAETVLGLKYSTFVYRMRNGCLRFGDYLKICEATGLSLDQLFRALGGETVRVPAPGFQEKEFYKHEVLQEQPAIVSGLDLLGTSMKERVLNVQPPEQKKEPVEAPFVVEDLPLTMPD